MTTIEIQGHVAPGFEPVRDRLARHFADGLERGAGVAVTLDGEAVVELWAGSADRAGAVPITAETLFPVFSCSKALSAVAVARVVGQGALDYDAPVARYWPDFGQAGKSDLTVAQVLSHQAGLPGFADDWSVEAWSDWDATCARLAAMAPLWPPGSRSGYHPVTWGYLAGEIVARASGRSIAAVIAEDFRAAHGVDVMLGLTDRDEGRAALAIKPPRPPDLGELNPETRTAFLTPWYSPASRGAGGRRLALPSISGHVTPLGMARMIQPFARGGFLGDAPVIPPEAVAGAVQERIAGPDLVLPYDMSWGAGVIRNTPTRHYYGPSDVAVGHTGFGGSCVLADPERRLTLAYAPTQQSPALVEDARAQGLIAAAYDCV